MPKNKKTGGKDTLLGNIFLDFNIMSEIVLKKSSFFLVILKTSELKYKIIKSILEKNPIQKIINR